MRKRQRGGDDAADGETAARGGEADELPSCRGSPKRRRSSSERSRSPSRRRRSGGRLRHRLGSHRRHGARTRPARRFHGAGEPRRHPGVRRTRRALRLPGEAEYRPDNSKAELLDVITKINPTTKTLFADTFEKIRVNFQEMFTELFGGGKANLVLTRRIRSAGERHRHHRQAARQAACNPSPCSPAARRP